MGNSNSKNKEREDKIRSGYDELREYAYKLMNQKIDEEERGERKIIEERKPFRTDLKTIKNTKYDMKHLTECGTPEEVASAIAAEREYKKMELEPPVSFSPKDREKIMERFSGTDDLKAMSGYINLYGDLNKYQDNLYKSYKVYQISIGDLSKFTTLWDEYSKMADVLTALITGRGLSNEEIQVELEKVAPMIQNKLVKYVYNEEKNKIEADIFQKGQLYDLVVEASKDAEDFLSIVKACIMVIEEFMTENCYYFIMPIIMDETIQIVKKEIYSHSIINDLYHKSRKNKILKSGGTVSDDDLKKAVVPDYNEIKPGIEYLNMCYNGLQKIRENSSYR